MAMEKVLKFVGGVPSWKLKVPPKSCIPRRAKIRMKRKRSNRRDMMDFMELRRETTKFRREDQYLEVENERMREEWRPQEGNVESDSLETLHTKGPFWLA